MCTWYSVWSKDNYNILFEGFDFTVKVVVAQMLPRPEARARAKTPRPVCLSISLGAFVMPHNTFALPAVYGAGREVHADRTEKKRFTRNAHTKYQGSTEPRLSEIGVI